MEPAEAILLILAKTAICDGQVAPSERNFLDEMIQLLGGDPADAILARARATTLAEIVPHLDRYADRFFVALRARMLARVDDHFDVREEAFFDKLVDQLELSDDDLDVIRQVADEEPDEPPERIRSLYCESSFFSSER